MATSANLVVRNEKGYVHVRCNYDGDPKTMLPALKNVNPNDVVRASEIRGIDPDGMIEAYPVMRARTPMVLNHIKTDDQSVSYTYVWNGIRWELYSDWTEN